MFPLLVHGRVVVPRCDFDYTSMLILLCIFMCAHSLIFVFWVTVSNAQDLLLVQCSGISSGSVLGTIWGARNGSQVSHV